MLFIGETCAASRKGAESGRLLTLPSVARQAVVFTMNWPVSHAGIIEFLCNLKQSVGTKTVSKDASAFRQIESYNQGGNLPCPNRIILHCQA